MLGDTSSEWLAERSADLDAGDIPALLSAARAFTLTGIKAAERDKALAYFEISAPRMRYRHFRSCGLFTGSGVVEAGCKSVIGQRLKLSGMHWSVPAPPASSPCAASKPADAGKKSGRSQTTRRSPLTSPARQVDLATYKTDAPRPPGDRWFCLTVVICLP